MSLTRERIEDIKAQVEIGCANFNGTEFAALCDLALSALSQEAVRDEALDEACQAMEIFADGKIVIQAKAAIRALKREPNAEAQVPARPSEVGNDGPMPDRSGPAPAAPDMAEIDRCLKYLSIRHFKHDAEISDVLTRCRAALLAKPGQGLACPRPQSMGEHACKDRTQRNGRNRRAI